MPSPTSTDYENRIVEAIRNNPGDIVHRLRRLHMMTPWETTRGAIEDAIQEIIDLRTADLKNDEEPR